MELCCLSENNFQEMKDHPIYRIRYPGKYFFGDHVGWKYVHL